MSFSIVPHASITGVVLAGGRGTRMGGVDKGLQRFRGQPLAQWTLQRLKPQVGALLVNANRNLEHYATWGASVCADGSELGDYAGPLAGVMTALAHCTTPYLVTVPCDTPLFPHDLVSRLAAALDQQNADFAVANGPEEDGRMRSQPVFCLMHTRMRDSLRQFTLSGGRKVDAWTAQHVTVQVPFNLPGDDPRSFFNANTLAELQRLESDTPTTASRP
jgi:molybdopterin-guanine dinucleotide biosynthesis protein A